MKLFRFFLVGIVFGIVMAKSEAMSWYRIQEMFRFHSFHMFGIIGTAVTLGVLGVSLIRKFNVRDYSGRSISFIPKERSMIRYLAGGTIFGLGWDLSGACPGPIVVKIGYGCTTMLVVFVFALLGTFLYGIVRNKLPH